MYTLFSFLWKMCCAGSFIITFASIIQMFFLKWSSSSDINESNWPIYRDIPLGFRHHSPHQHHAVSKDLDIRLFSIITFLSFFFQCFFSICIYRIITKVSYWHTFSRWMGVSVSGVQVYMNSMNGDKSVLLVLLLLALFCQ